jgi:ATP-dependent RNA circularization protein (DNA/RNA ligase family)
MQEDVVDIIIFGEVFGPGVQDLQYGEEKVTFRCFDISVSGNYLPFYHFRALCNVYNIPTVPVLYVGKYSREVLNSLTDGKSTLADHIREGVVVKALEESCPRQILKSVSVDYLSR